MCSLTQHHETVVKRSIFIYTHKIDSDFPFQFPILRKTPNTNANANEIPFKVNVDIFFSSRSISAFRRESESCAFYQLYRRGWLMNYENS